MINTNKTKYIVVGEYMQRYILLEWGVVEGVNSYKCLDVITKDGTSVGEIENRSIGQGKQMTGHLHSTL